MSSFFLLFFFNLIKKFQPEAEFDTWYFRSKLLRGIDPDVSPNLKIQKKAKKEEEKRYGKYRYPFLAHSQAGFGLV